MISFKTYAVLILGFLILWGPLSVGAAAEDENTPAGTDNRVVSVFASQDFINEQLALHMAKSELFKDMKIELSPKPGQIFLRGKFQVPLEELKAVNLDPKLGSFRFQITIKPSVSSKGHLILDFPLNETYFYPATSKDIKNERVIVPVQMMSLVLASARGYLSALSGDFTSFDRRAAKLSALIKALGISIAQEKNADALDDLKTQRDSLKLQLAAVPLERKQLQSMSKTVEHLFSFTGEKEINLNDELGARKNGLIFKINLSQLTPFLAGVELGGTRILRDKKDGGGENYFALDVNSSMAAPPRPKSNLKPADRVGAKVAPSLIMRINEGLFESDMLVQAEKKKMVSNLRNLQIRLLDDGLHVGGEWHKFFITIPFDTVVDFVTTDVDVFEMRVRKLDVAGIDLEFLTKFVLEALQVRLDHALKGMCKFEYVGVEQDKSRALQVTVDSKSLVPAFPDLHILDVDVRDREFLLKIGHL